MIRVAVIFANYGPYHVVRAGSLSGIEDIESQFIELAPSMWCRQWQIARDELSFPLTTLANKSYENTTFAMLFRELVSVLERLRPDAVVIPSYSPPIMLAAARWAKMNGAASIMMNDSTEIDHKRIWWKERIKRFLVKRYYNAAFVSGRASRQYMLQLGMPEEYIWEGYDVTDNEHFSCKADQVLEDPGKRKEQEGLLEHYFLYVGRFVEKKNLSRLLEAYYRYREREPNGWGLVLVGDGPQRQKLHGKAQSLGLKDIVWPGFKQADELPIYYALASAFVLPSVSEQWGLVVNEAMASGLPVLVSNRCGSAWDLVSEGNNGYTFDPYNVEEMAKRMLRLGGTEETERRAMGEASRKIISRYTPEFWGEQLADCIRQTVPRSSVERP